VRGNVLIRGWGATLLLKSVPHIPCIRVTAPLDMRVRRLMERLETDDESLARHEIEVDDRARATRMGEAFDVAWGDPALYDLTLNTGRVSIATCVDQVLALARSPGFQETPASRQLLEDMALQARVQGALRADPRTSNIDIVVDARAGTIRLAGIVVDETERSRCAALAAEVTGVKAVEDELRIMQGGLYRFPSQPRA
jgi:hypothetical protein